jgi:hypothetical protein
MFTVLLAGSVSFAQSTTDAPNQNEPAMLENTNATTNTVTNVTAVTNKPVVTEEKEVVASNGIVYNDGKMDFVAPDVQFQINATDTGSGVKNVWVVVDNAAFGIYSHAVSVSQEGRHNIGYKVEDQVGNFSPVKNYDFIVDGTAPVVSIHSIDKGIKMGDTFYISASNRLALNAMDNLSGVKDIQYTIDGGSWQTYTEPIASGLSNGMHKIQYKATDNVGNESAVKSFMLFVDNTPPVASIDVSPAVYTSGDKTYCSPEARFTLSGKDNETSVAKILYTVDNGQEQEYFSPLRLTSGTHTITVKAIDLLGNVSDPVSMTVEVDGDNPSANLVPSK